eukprot:s737_g10.t1
MRIQQACSDSASSSIKEASTIATSTPQAIETLQKKCQPDVRFSSLGIFRNASQVLRLDDLQQQKCVTLSWLT